MMSARTQYRPKQLLAINEIDRNLQIIACAGSGKTEVISARVVEILKRKAEAGVAPRNIVAFTFTDRAAVELKDRISRLVAEELGNALGLAEMYVGTIHGYCLELLQTYVYKFLKFGVLTEIQARLLVDRYSSQSGLRDLGLRRFAESQLFLDVLAAVREAKVDRSRLEGHPVWSALEKYDRLLEEKAYFDYTKMMGDAVKALLSDDDLRDKVAERVKYVVVDEYQDVNPLQEMLVQTLHDLGANVCVVGDDDQTIYQWRGTDVQNILTFSSRYPSVRPVTIEENFRSSRGVVDCARAVIQHNNPDRLPKQMVSADKQPFERGDVLCLGFDNPEDEARWIADKILTLRGVAFRDRPGSEERGLTWSDCAILLRTVRRNAGPVLEALRAARIPYVVAGMTNLFDTPEVQAARAMFLYMVDQIDRIQLRTAWQDADLGLSSDNLDAGVAFLDLQRQWKRDERWSAYNIQRTYLGFLEAIQLQEESIPRDRGEIVYYNLGKFSQVISDYEQIHFQSDPKTKYEGFAGFLVHQAPDYYPEGWEDAAHARPDAVQVMTVHQAKGQQWPVVFVPALQKNRFPSMKHGGKGKWHVIPRDAVVGADRYDGNIQDERRLFYVALTRSQKYLFCTWAPQPGNQLYRRVSPFFNEAATPVHVLTREPSRPPPRKLPPKPKVQVVNVALTFSELKYYFECPYQFKLRFLYGFNPAIDEALGYGKSLHDALAEVHKRALDRDFASPEDAEDLLEHHLHLPFAYPELREDLRRAGVAAVKRYLEDNAQLLDKRVHSEQVVEIHLAEGIVVNGRIDLIRRTDTNETMVVDFKSTKRVQQEDVTRQQLHIYAMGYRELTGQLADLIEIHNLDRGGVIREEVDIPMMQETARAVIAAGNALRENRLPRLRRWSESCANCDMAGVCRTRPASGPGRQRFGSR
jgi:DNA helicase-2/ATP-dependent DNA helicase PcrA